MSSEGTTTTNGDVKVSKAAVGTLTEADRAALRARRERRRAKALAARDVRRRAYDKKLAGKKAAKAARKRNR